MNAIASNPFRTLGAWANALASEIVSNRGRMTALIKMGRGADSPLDLTHILGPVERTADILTDAEAHLTMTDERLLAAQFWFINLTADDVLAAQHLAAGRSDQALALWQGRNSVSALQNSAVLHLALGDTASATRAVAQLYGEHADEFISALRLDHTVTAAELVRNYTSTLAAQCPDADLSALMPHDGSSEHIPVPEQSIPVPEQSIIVPEQSIIVPEQSIIEPELGIIVPEQSIPAEEVAIVTPHTEPASPSGQTVASTAESMTPDCIADDCDSFNARIAKINTQEATLGELSALIADEQVILDRMAQKVGPDHPTVTACASNLANLSINLCVYRVNIAIATHNPSDIASSVNDTKGIFQSLASMHLDDATQKRFEENRASLYNIYSYTHPAPVPPVPPTKKDGDKGCLSKIGTYLIGLLIFGGYKACRNISIDTTQDYDLPEIAIPDSIYLQEPVDIDISKFEVLDFEPPEVPEFDFSEIPEINIPDLPEPPNHDNVNEETFTKIISTQDVINEDTPLTPPSTQDVPDEQ